MDAPLSACVTALCKGKVKRFARGENSGIAKRSLQGRIAFGPLGLFGDEQADLKHHGGHDKAVHHYPHDHYARWQEGAPRPELLTDIGAFGENISTSGLLEDQVCIGDRYRLGTVLLEISQGRQPCWKQGVRLDWDLLPALMVKERRSGWYYRVIESGEAAAGDSLDLVDRPLPDWSVARVFGLLIAGDHRRDAAALPVLMAMEKLYSGWRKRARDLMAS
jgi:MOSC domain-containing protein YiiM